MLASPYHTGSTGLFVYLFFVRARPFVYPFFVHGPRACVPFLRGKLFLSTKLWRTPAAPSLGDRYGVGVLEV